MHETVEEKYVNNGNFKVCLSSISQCKSVHYSGNCNSEELKATPIAKKSLQMKEYNFKCSFIIF